MNLRELAESLGLSQTTVSRALNGYPEVNEGTRQRVLEAARQNNYAPNTRAMGLVTGNAMSIGHVIPLFNRNDVVNPIFGEFVAGASQTYSENGYELLLTVVEKNNEEDIYRNLAAKGAVDGVIVHSPRKQDSRVTLLRNIGMPFVVHGRINECNEPYSWVDMNNRCAFEQACQLLLDLGHQRIALINGDDTLNFAWLRYQGYCDAIKAAGLKIDTDLVSNSDLTETHGYTAASRMLASANPPTALIASSYVVAIGIRRAISQAGLKIGKDVSVVAHDDELSFFDNQGDYPQFTAIRSSVREAGERAAQMLLDIIKEPESAPSSYLMKAQITLGASTGQHAR